MNSPSAPSLTHALGRAVEGILRRLHVALPGRVLSYDATTQLADVKPMIPRMVPQALGGFLAEALPIIPAVPVVFPRCGQFFLSLPIAPGDSVLLVFCDYDPQEWRRTGEEVSPGVVRRGHVSNAVAIPGIEPRARQLASASATNLVLGQDGSSKPKLIVELDGNVRLGTQSGGEDFVALAGKLKTLFDAFANAVPVANDGGAAIHTAFKTAWQTTLGSSAASSKVRAD